MTAVKVHKDENIEVAIKKFLNKIKKSGLIKELQERRFYKKPSAIKNEKNRRRKKVMKQLQEQQELDKKD